MDADRRSTIHPDLDLGAEGPVVGSQDVEHLAGLDRAEEDHRTVLLLGDLDQRVDDTTQTFRVRIETTRPDGADLVAGDLVACKLMDRWVGGGPEEAPAVSD
mgnify:CR=1 FL=1